MEKKKTVTIKSEYIALAVVGVSLVAVAYAGYRIGYNATVKSAASAAAGAASVAAEVATGVTEATVEYF